MLIEVRSQLLVLLRKFLNEGKLEEAETMAYCYRCLGDKEVEIHHVPVVAGSQKEMKDIEKEARSSYLSALLGKRNDRY